MELKRQGDSTRFWISLIENQELQYKVEKLFNYLEDFFVLPASIKHHHAYKGGLDKHTAQVCSAALSLNEDLEANFNKDDILLAALLHDVGKVNEYKFKENSKDEFEFSNDGVCSQEMFVMHVVAKFDIELSLDIVSAIEFAHGGWSSNISATKYIKLSKLAYLIHMADLWSSQFQN